MYETARYSSLYESSFDPGHVKSAERGKNFVCVLADGINEPRGKVSVGSKVTRIIIENYLRRPSLRDEAISKILEFADNGVMITQTPAYRVQCATAALMISKNCFRWIQTGQVSLFHFVDGQVVHASDMDAHPPIGAGETTGDVASAVYTLGEGENSFLVCSDSFAKYVHPGEMEKALSAADSAEQWLAMMKGLYEDRSQGEPYSIMTVFVPSKRRRFMKKGIVIALVALLLVAAVFFGLGAMRRGQGGPGPGPGMGGPQDGPNAPTHPPEPTRPVSVIIYDRELSDMNVG